MTQDLFGKPMQLVTDSLCKVGVGGLVAGLQLRSAGGLQLRSAGVSASFSGGIRLCQRGVSSFYRANIIVDRKKGARADLKSLFRHLAAKKFAAINTMS